MNTMGKCGCVRGRKRGPAQERSFNRKQRRPELGGGEKNSRTLGKRNSGRKPPANLKLNFPKKMCAAKKHVGPEKFNI